jgi:hypothetical protein
MVDALHSINKIKLQNKETVGIICVEKNGPFGLSAIFHDVVLIHIVEHQLKENEVKHYVMDGKNVGEYIINEEKLKQWIINGEHQHLINWVFTGKIIYERSGIVTNMKNSLFRLPESLRTKKLGVEFAEFIHLTVEGARLFKENQPLDAYHQLVQALNHLGRFAIINHGFHPELTVWNQLREIEPEVYKLYVELVKSEEEIEKRIELILIASGFSLSAQTSLGSQHLIEVMRLRNGPWSLDELIKEQELADYGVNLHYLLTHLLEKGYIETVFENKNGMTERKYKINVD